MDTESTAVETPDVASSSVDESIPANEIMQDSKMPGDLTEKDSGITSLLNEEKSLNTTEPVEVTHESRKKGRSRGRHSARGRQYSGSSHSSNVSSLGRSQLPERPGITFDIGSRLRVRDYTKQWYDAKIVEVNEEAFEIKIHFDRWNSRYDNWVKMDSPDIRAISPERLKKMSANKKYEINEEVLAKWKDRNMYPAKVISIVDNACYKVLFYDGLVSKMQSSNIEPLPPGYVGKLQFPSVTGPKRGKKVVLQDTLQVENAAAPHTDHAVATKEFVIEEDHNHFKCQVPDCTKSFRKEKLLESHMKHYHDMKYDPSKSTSSSSKSSNEQKMPLESSSKKLIESALVEKETLIHKTPQPAKVKQKVKSEVEKAIPPPKQIAKKVKTTRPTSVSQSANLPQRSSSRRVSLPAKLASDEICLLQQPVRRDRTPSTCEKSVEKHEVAKIPASKSLKIKEKAKTTESSEELKKTNIKIEPEPPSPCDSAGRHESIKSLEPIRRMITENVLDPTKIELMVTLKSTSRAKDKSISPARKKSFGLLPKTAITEDTHSKDGSAANELIQPVVKKGPAKVKHKDSQKIFSDKSNVSSTSFTDSEKELNDQREFDIHKEPFIKEESDAPSDISLSAKIPESGAEGKAHENLTSLDTQCTAGKDNDVEMLPVKKEIDAEISSSFLTAEKETVGIASEMTALASEINESEPVAVPASLTANNASSEDKAEFNSLPVQSSEGKYSESSEIPKGLFHVKQEPHLNLEKPMYKKLDTVVSTAANTPGHVMCTRRKEAILEKEKAAQSIGGHVMCTRKKSEKLAAVEEHFRQKTSGPKKSEAPFLPKSNKRRRFFSPPRDKPIAAKQEYAQTNVLNTEPHRSDLNNEKSVSSVMKHVKTDSSNSSSVDVKVKQNYREAPSTHSKPVMDEVVHCICDSMEEEGLMMQCEVCLTWQHGFCFNIHEEKDVPEKYVCYACLEPKGLRESCRYKHEQDYYKKGQLPSFSFPNQPHFLKNSTINPNSIIKTQQCVASIINVKNVLHSVAHRLNIVSAESHPDLHLFEKSGAEESTDEAEMEDKELEVHDGNAGNCNISPSQNDLDLDGKSSSKNLVSFDHSYYSPEADILDLDAMPLIIEEDIKSDVETLSCVDTPTDSLVPEKTVPKELDFLQSNLTLPSSVSDRDNADKSVNDSAPSTVNNEPQLHPDAESVQLENSSFPSTSDSASIIADSLTLGTCSDLQSCSFDSNSAKSSGNPGVCSASVDSKKDDLEIKDGEMAVINLNSGAISHNAESLAFLFNESEDNSNLPTSSTKLNNNSPMDIFNDFNISSKCKRILMDNVKCSLNATTAELDRIEEIVDALEQEELVRKAKVELWNRCLREASQVPVHRRLKRLLGDLGVVEQILKFQ